MYAMNEHPIFALYANYSLYSSLYT